MARRRRRQARYVSPRARWSAVEPWIDPDPEAWDADDGLARVALDAEQIAALARALAQFEPQTRARGERYAAGGRVQELGPIDGGFTAVVHGGALYETVWVWANRGWAATCGCPVGFDCKHAYAAARIVLTHQSEVIAPPALAAAPAAPPARGGRGAGTALAERLRAVPERWRRAHLLTPLVMAQPVPIQIAIEHAEILDETDPEVLCWRLARLIADHGGTVPGELRAYVDRADLANAQAVRARAELVGDLVRWAEARRPEPARRLRLLARLEARGNQVVVGIEVRLTSTRIADEPRNHTQIQQLRNEATRTPDLFAPEQAAALRVLTDPAHILAGAGYYEHRLIHLNGRGLAALCRLAADSSLLTWDASTDTALAARGGAVAGTPLRFDATEARLLPVCTARDGATAVELAYVWPDGRQRAQGAVLPLTFEAPWGGGGREAPLVLADGILSPLGEAPERRLVDRFATAGALPLAGEERARVMTALAGAFPHLRPVLAAHTRTVDARPLVALDLRADDWLQIRLFAPAREREWTPDMPLAGSFEYAPPGRWQRAGGDTPVPADAEAALTLLAARAEADDGTPATGGAAPARTATGAAPGDGSDAGTGEAWIEAPREAHVAPAIAWLSALPVERGTVRRPGGHIPSAEDRDVGWWMKLSPRSMEAFAQAWPARPPDATYVGNRRMRRLLLDEDAWRPQVRVTASGQDWFAVSADWAREGMALTEADLNVLRSARTPFVRLSGGWVQRTALAAHEASAALLADLGLEIGAEPQRLTVWQLAGAAPESLAALSALGADGAAMEALRALRARVAAFDGLPEIAAPAGLQAELRPYQRRGLDFLVHAAQLGVGALLADDMGLGKTLQALAWLAHQRAADPAGGPSLVVCPTSVLHNWVREAARFTPGLRVLALERGAGRQALFAAVDAHELVVTTYALLRRDADTWREVRLRALILDEAQNLKNPDAVGTRVVRTLTARHRLALTGTPLENRALDLWSLVECVTPGYLGPRARFAERFDRLDAAPHTRRLLAAKLRPILLRRTKGEVAADLPPRIEERLDCELSREQRLLYVDALRRARTLVAGIDSRQDLARQRLHILAALTRLRQICCHPALAGGKRDLPSGKFDALFELVEPLLAEGHKVLVFSQFVACLTLLEKALTARAVPTHRLTGATTRRQQVVDAFQADDRPGVFLISLKAGGTGLNLTAASYVVLFDPWWNPAVEAQAIDRTHRIGQDRTVIAYRLIARETIEEKIFALQQQKAALARDVLGEDGFARALSRADLDYLFAET